MDKENIKKWVEALRSKRFTQITQELTYECSKEYCCCLGVACVIAQENNVPVSDHQYMGRQTSELPELVGRWLGISREDQQELASMNDEGDTFEKIADYIEGVFDNTEG